MENNSTKHGRYAINGSRNEMGGNGFSLRALAPVNNLGFELTSEPSKYHKASVIQMNAEQMDTHGETLGGLASGGLRSNRLDKSGAANGGFMLWTDAAGIERARMMPRRPKMKFDNGYRK